MRGSAAEDAGEAEWTVRLQLYTALHSISAHSVCVGGCVCVEKETLYADRASSYGNNPAMKIRHGLFYIG